MMSLKWEKLIRRQGDVFFVAVLVLCVLLALAAIGSGLERGDLLLASGGARKVDITKIRKQISDGELSARKALFYRRITE